MSYTFFIAKRYLQFQQKQGKKSFASFLTVIATIGVALGVAALIITLTILGGFEKEIKEKVTGFVTHIQITGFQNQPLANFQTAQEKIHSFKNITGSSPFVIKEGMVQYQNNMEGIVVKGINPQTDVTLTKKYMVEGKYIFSSSLENPTCIIGKKLLTKLHAQIGDTIIVFGLRGSYTEIQSPRIMSFIINGVYESGMSEFDDVYIFVSLPVAQELFGMQNAISGFDIMVDNISNAPTFARSLMDTLGYPYYARTLFQLYRNLFTWIELQKEPIPIILGLIIIVATVNIIGILLMLVLEKKQYIGILMAMGTTRSAIKKIFLYQGIIIGIVGTLFGNLLAFFLCWMQLQFHFFSLPSSIYFMSSVPILLRWENFLLVSCITIFLCSAASYIPSMLAARLDPIRSIRFF